MRAKTKRLFLLSFLMLVITVYISVCIAKIDVAPIGTCDTSVGFSTLNGYFAERLPYLDSFYKASEVCGYIALAVCSSFGMVGFVQLVKNRSFLKVEPEIYALGTLYFVYTALYLCFDKVLVINYRPILMAGELFPESSYPSSHTMLSTVVFGSAVMMLPRYIKNPVLCNALRVICVLLIPITILTRYFSGYHWFTDIIGGLLVSAVLLLLFAASLSAISDFKENKKIK